MEKHVCLNCGAPLKKEGDIYTCPYCRATYEDDAEERASVTLKSLLDEERLDRYSRAKRVLYTATHAKYPSAEEVLSAARAVLAIEDQDILANVYLFSHDDSPYRLNPYLASLKVAPAIADEILRWLLPSLSRRSGAAIKHFVELNYRDRELTERLTEVEDVLQALDAGTYEAGMLRDVFIAYSSADTEQVIQVVDLLEENGLACFVAFRNLRHGKGAAENYLAEIHKAIAACSVFVLVSSPHSLDAGCDAMRVELPYLCTHFPDKPRIQYVIKDAPRVSFIVNKNLKAAFPNQEWCRDEEDLLTRIFDILSQPSKEEAERIRLEEERRKLEAEKARAAAEAEAERQRLERERRQNAEEAERIRAEAEEARRKAAEAAKPNQFKLSVRSVNPAQGTASVAVGEGYVGESTCVTATPMDGFAFAGWYAGSKRVSEDAMYFFEMPEKDVSLIATWSKVQQKPMVSETSLSSVSAKPQPKPVHAAPAEPGSKPVLSPDGKTITYGIYPQKRVGDPILIKALDALSSPEANGYYLHQGVYYAKTIAKPDGSERVFDDGTTIVEGKTYWFKCEPIEWRVLSEKRGKYFVLSDVLLDAHRYNETYKGGKDGYYPSNYLNSEIRAWLNGEFLGSAFALDDSAILTTDVDNGAATTDSTSNTYACANTRDKVFLPSYKDCLNPSYGFSTSKENNDTRCAKTTDWARARGAFYKTSNVFNGCYWLRSPYSGSSYFAWKVYRDGSLYSGEVYYAHQCVRPCLTLKIESLESAAKPAPSVAASNANPPKISRQSAVKPQSKPRVTGFGEKPILSPDRKTVTYGLYPRNRVGNPSLIATLNGLTSKAKNGFYLHQGIYYAKAKAKPWTRGLYFSDGTPIVDGEVYWFECEPLTWKVLSGKGGTYLLVADAVIDAHRYKNSYSGAKNGVYANNYAASEIRSWLNGGFFRSAFGLNDVSVLATDVDNGIEAIGPTKPEFVCENTKDKVFLPSSKDYMRAAYGFPTSKGKTPSRSAEPTDWARVRGAACARLSSDENRYGGWYWTRTPDGPFGSFWVGSVDADGAVSSSAVGFDCGGVRPSITVKID